MIVKLVGAHFDTKTLWYSQDMHCGLPVCTVRGLVLFVVLCSDDFVCTVPRADEAVLAFSFTNRFEDDAQLQTTLASVMFHTGMCLSRYCSLMRS